MPRFFNSLTRSVSGQLALLLLVSCAVYLPWLGTKPLDFSEGLRCIPGWQMLHGRLFWNIALFELTYIRKPPGMPWAVAVVSTVLGESPWSARVPSALAAMVMPFIAWWFARKWFSALPSASSTPSPALAAPLVAGLAQALLPLMWAPGRSGEIEMLNNLGTQLMALGLADVLLSALRQRQQPSVHPLAPAPEHFTRHFAVVPLAGIGMATIGIVVAALAKGPASLPVLVGIFLGAAAGLRSIRIFATPWLWITLLTAITALTPIAIRLYGANDTPYAVRQDISEAFLWNRERILGIATLAPVALATMLPASLGLLLVFGRGAREAAAALTPAPTSPTSPAAPPVALSAARLLACTALASLVIMMAAGISNPRYAMPVAVVLPPLAAYAFLLLGGSTPLTKIARLCFLGRPLHMLIALLIGASVFVALASRPTPDQQAGVRLAQQFADRLLDDSPPWAEASPAQLQPSIILWADDAIEARPDILWLIQTSAARNGRVIRPQWRKFEMLAASLPRNIGGCTYLLVRTDDQSQEIQRYASAIKDGRLVEIDRGRVRQHEYALLRAVPAASSERAAPALAP